MRQIKHSTAVHFLAALILLPAAFAQDEVPTAVTTQNRTGDLPFSTSVGTDIEHVDIASGNLIVRIPITVVKGRGMDFNFVLNYDALFWATATRTGSNGFKYQKWNIEKREYLLSDGIGWTANTPRVTSTHSTFICGQNSFGIPLGSGEKYNGYIYHDSDGGKHPLGIHWEGADCPAYGSYVAETMEAPDHSAAGIYSYLPADFSATQILLADGTEDKPTSSTTVVDSQPNGYVTSQTLYGDYRDADGNQKKEIAGGLDTLGRTIVTRQDLTNQILYKVYDSSGVLRTYTVNFGTVSGTTSFGVSGPFGAIQEAGFVRKGITSIVLPNGRSYSFQHESGTYGGLTRIDLPTGAYITYTWATYSCSDTTHRYVASRTLNVGGQSYVWTFTRTPGQYCGQNATVTVTDPEGNQSVYVTTDGHIDTASLYQGAATGNPLRKYDLTYQNFGPYSSSKNYLPTQIKTTLEDGRASQTEYDYETFTYTDVSCAAGPDTCSTIGPTTSVLTTTRGNVTAIREYDWGAVPGTYGQGVPGALLRRTTNEYLHNSNTAYADLNIVDKIIRETIYDGAGVQQAKTEYEYDSTAITATSGAPQHDYTLYPSTFLYRGNATKVKRWRNTDGATLTTTYAYDDLGNIRSITDPGSHTSTWTYTDSWSGSGCQPPSNSQAYVTQATNHLGHRLQLTRYPCTGLVQARKDENDIVAGRAGTTFTYDLFGRILTQVATDGGQVTNVYNDTPPVTVTSTSKITSTLNLVSLAVQDGLGRTTQTQLTSDPEGTVFADTTYDALGRTKTASNPYRSTSDPTYGLTETQYDALGRVIKVIPPDGSPTANNVTSVYAGMTTTVTDQAGKVRKSETDALGRLIRVWEPNSSGSLVNKTRYFYDTLGNLTCVLQLATDAEPANCNSPNTTWRPRTFTYNSLSQLLSATNPESGAITYTYDSEGNVLTKVAPKPNQTGALNVTTTYTYDALHRLTGKTYSNGDPAVTYKYDQTVSDNGLTVANGKGRRTTMLDASGSSGWSYDVEGRAYYTRRVNSGITNNLAYLFNLDGSLWRVTFPSGRVNEYLYGGAGRPLSLRRYSSVENYLENATYAPHGALAGTLNGRVSGGFAGTTTAYTYNNRLQPQQLVTTGTLDLSCTNVTGKILHFYYGFNLGTANNGNVASISNCKDSTRSQSFTYDELNRIKTAQSAATSGTNCWGDSFAYDIWANLLTKTVTKCTAETLSVTANTRNQITNTGFTYDAAGNLTNSGSGVMTYNAEGQLTNAAGVTYTYDGDGNRVKKSSGRLYWYGPDGQLISESDLAGVFAIEHMYFQRAASGAPRAPAVVLDSLPLLRPPGVGQRHYQRRRRHSR